MENTYKVPRTAFELDSLVDDLNSSLVGGLDDAEAALRHAALIDKEAADMLIVLLVMKSHFPMKELIDRITERARDARELEIERDEREANEYIADMAHITGDAGR